MNDVLCRIGECWRYAEKFDRTLIIDARKSELGDHFSNYFEPKYKAPNIIFDANDVDLEFLNGLPCFPAEMRGQLRRLDAILRETPRLRATSDHSLPDIDFSRNYQEAVLAHEQWGGGSLSFGLIDKLRLSAKIRPTILNRVRQFDGKYYAVHVRNTDLQTDYKDFFSKISQEVWGKRLLVCSDDAAVIEYARSFFSSSEILTSSEIPDTGGKPLHICGDRKKSNIDTIVDLLALAKSERLFFAHVTEGRLSGFSGLAGHLCKNKYLIDDLLNIPQPIDFSTVRRRITRHRRDVKHYLRRKILPYFQTN